MGGLEGLTQRPTHVCLPGLSIECLALDLTRNASLESAPIHRIVVVQVIAGNITSISSICRDRAQALSRAIRSRDDLEGKDTGQC